jgi:hypothetical protein
MENSLIHELRCKRCGNKIETIPMQCGYSISLNQETNEWECYMGPEYGFMKLNEMICTKCLISECYP